MKDQTIAAVATPPGRGGIGIIRISGEHALNAAKRIFRASKPDNPLDSHRLYHGHVVDPETGCTIDEVLLAVMKKPHSYTREDVAEIHTHAGPVVLAATLELVLKSGVRLAEPGEFTKRAFLNGRIDLTQAEAVIDIINAKTDQSLQIAVAQIKGGLKDTIGSVRDTLIEVQAVLGAAIDFPDETQDVIETSNIYEKLAGTVANVLEGLIKHYRSGRFIRDGIKVLIAGRPNVGKSSLMNRFLKKDRAIVTSIPGTTRDFLEETIDFNGLPATIVDTAGLQKTDNPVESIGIEKTESQIEIADLILFLIEADRPLVSQDHWIYEQIGEKPLIVVMNKADLVTGDGYVTTPPAWKRQPHIKTSALNGHGVEDLKKEIVQTVLGQKPLYSKNRIIPNLRHTLALERARVAVQKTVDAFASGISPELASIDIGEAIESIDEILGINAKSDVLAAVFDQFCIGK